MTIAIITDTHFGARSGSSIFRNYMKEWWDTEFFRICKERGVKTVLHGGDFFDNRNSISLQDIDLVVNWFAKKIIDLDLQFIVVLGNHDVAHKNTNKIHSLSVLKSAAPDNVKVIESVESITIDNQDFALVPWINDSNYSETMSVLDGIKNKDETIVLGHFEFAGHKHYQSSRPAEHGLDQQVFKDFKEVWSGHFHHPNKIGNTRYLGSAFYFTWQDYGDDRGFWIFEDNKLEYIKNQHCLFSKVEYEKFDKSATDDQKKKFFNQKFVRIVIEEEYKKTDLLDLLALVQRESPHDIQVIDNNILRKSEDSDSEESLDEEKTAKSTEQYVLDYIEDSENDDVNNDTVKTLMESIITQAKDRMAKGE